MSLFTYGTGTGAVALDGNANFKIKEIVGLSTIESDMNSITVPGTAGERNVEIRAKNRPITLYLRPFGNIKASVDYILSVFRIGRVEDFICHYSSGNRIISTVVRDIDIPRFSDQVVAVISLECPYPYFRSEIATSVTLSAGSAITVDGAGASAVGAAFNVQITATGSVTNPKFENLTTGETLELIGTFEEGLLTIRTEQDRKAIVFFPPGDSPISSFGWLKPGSEWITLSPGTNSIRFSASSGSDYTASILYFKEFV